MTKGSRIRDARLSAGLTMEELGKRIGTTKQNIYRYEKDLVTDIPMARLLSIAQATGVKISYLMCFDQLDVLETKQDYINTANSLSAIGDERGAEIMRNASPDDENARFVKLFSMLSADKQIEIIQKMVDML